jgi:ABC-2 type transport system ATP-binding protein
MIKINNISKSFGAFKALDKLSLQVKEGEFYSLLGPNGAGKTTCINIISNITKASQGSVEIAGLNTNIHPMEVKKKMGIVPQEIALYEDLSAYENLRFWGKINGVSASNIDQKIEETLAFLNLSDQKHKKIASYSGGMKRRINIAAALLHEPEVLFMDEPTVGIDPQSRIFTYEIFEKLHQQGKTVFYTSHNMEEVERLSDRIGIIDHGQLIAQGSLEDLKKDVDLQESLHISFEKNQKISRQLLESMLGTEQFTYEDEHLFFNTQNASKDLVKQVQIFDQHQIRIQNIEVKKVNLEMIFLQLTGKKLRE